ncbi:ABC transporter permease [Microvirga yunnanensis]|uniref:ABC transporter permease n=1 Tax=Microvirga yunnanensis TaxID=2953740 RepID=UPI0021C6CB6D|nr:ABC transporter permease [Microvirga sp. HBU65207]
MHLRTKTDAVAQIATLPDAETPVGRLGEFNARPIPQLSLATFAIVLVLWWVATLSGNSSIGLPTPSDVMAALRDLTRSGDLLKHLGASLQRLILGWILGACCGIGVGFAIGLFSWGRSIALPLVSAIFPIPKVALLPLFILWFGIGEGSKVATIAAGVFSPMVFATYSGVGSVDRNVIRMAQTFGLPRRSILWKIILPGTVPALLSGSRISCSIALILLTAAEMIGAQHGLGALVLASGNLMRTDQLFVGILMLSVLGVSVSVFLSFLERVLLHWR